MKQRMVLGLSALVLSLIAVAPAGADTKTTTVCRMDYSLKGWSAFYKGGGLTAGKSVVRDGHGKFSEVADIKELFGSYVTGTAAAGAGESSEAQAMTKGEVSLALAGNGTGVELGVSFGKFTITPR